VVIGACQLASCFGPAYEVLFILKTALRKAKIRVKGPMSFVTPDPVWAIVADRLLPHRCGV
jgi:sulfide:quinone oxidoreductase